MTAWFETAGSATIGYRVEIDGCPYQGVTGPQYVTGSSVGDRIDGLKIRNAQFSIRADPLTAKLEVGALQIQLVDVGNVWSSVFDLEPSATTWLTQDLTVGETTTAHVLSTEGWPSSGRFWVDGETIAYASIGSATTFSTLTRGVLSPDTDAAQAHYISNGINARSPEVTNWPVLWEGRRVCVFRYDEGDNPFGAGHQIYRGVISGSPSFDGKAWSINVDPVSSLLDQTLGADLSQSLGPAGVHFPSTNPFVMTIAQDKVSGGAFIDNVSFSVSVTGAFATQEAFCTQLQTNLIAAAGAAGASGTFAVIPEGNVGWHLTYTTDAIDPRECFVLMGSPIEAPLGTLPGTSAAPVPAGQYGFPQDQFGTPRGFQVGHSLVANTTYYFLRPMQDTFVVDTPLGGAPRGIWSYAGDDTDRTIYLDGTTPLPSTTTQILCTVHDVLTDADLTVTLFVSAVDTGARNVTVSNYISSSFAYVPGDGQLSVRLGLQLQDSPYPTGGSIADVLDYVAANSSTLTTLGVLPSLRTEDFDSARWHDFYDPLPPINSNRIFTTFSPVSLGDMTREELKAAGFFLSMDNSGALIPARIRLATQAELSAIATVDETTLLTSSIRAQHEVNALGLVNQFTYRDGFNPESGKQEGDTFIVRDVTAFGQSSAVRTQDVAQKSLLVATTPVTQADVLALAAPVLGALGSKYAVDTMDAAKSEAVEVGAALVFDNPYLLADVATTSGIPAGTLGMLGRVGIVLGKEWAPYSPKVRFTVLNTKRPIAGYAPAGFVTAHTNTSGNTWNVTIGASYLPSGRTAADFFETGDAVQVVKWNASTATVVTGVVGSVASNVVTVTFGATWTPGASTWYLTIGSASDINPSQARFCLIADATGVIDTGGVNFARAQAFAP